MTRLLEYTVARGEELVDEVAAVISASWPRSTVAREIARLVEDGHESGTVRDVAFSLSFESAEVASSAIPAMRGAGFTIEQDPASARGFVVARCPILLRTYDLARTLSRLNRVVAPFGGFAAMIGPIANGRQGAMAEAGVGTGTLRAAS
jgi:hypothetical protein